MAPGMEAAVGRGSNGIVHVTDLFTTLLAMADLPVPCDRIPDGKDQSAFLYGQQEDSYPDGFLHSMGTPGALPVSR